MVSAGINDAARQGTTAKVSVAAADERSGSGETGGNTAVSGSGKSSPSLVANPEVEVVANDSFATTEIDDDFQADNQASGKLSGWRIERNTNGFYRYRWQIKDESGQSETYITSTGNTGYRRGSKYLPKLQALQELGNGKNKRKKRH